MVLQPTTAENDLFPADRTEACAVVGTAADKSSYNIYVHGGVSTVPSSVDYAYSRSLASTGFTAILGWRIQGRTYMHKCPWDVHGWVQGSTELRKCRIMDVTVNMEYRVPEKVYNIIGGSGTGGAVYTSPKNGFINTKLYDIVNVISSSPFKTTTPNTTSPNLSSSTPSSSIPKIAGGVIGALVL
ncbi:hypothetical protein EV426DRAFT_707454 [Tirmania nivea]|nr:hypothetical protein EV426DRAFT_707454 [Tirmania nivea]